MDITAKVKVYIPAARVAMLVRKLGAANRAKKAPTKAIRNYAKCNDPVEHTLKAKNEQSHVYTSTEVHMKRRLVTT